MATSHSFTRSIADVVEEFGVEVDDAVEVDMGEARPIDTLVIDLSDVEQGRVMFQCGDHTHEVSASSVIRIQDRSSSFSRSFRLKDMTERDPSPAPRGGRVSRSDAAAMLDDAGLALPTDDELATAAADVWASIDADA